MKVTVCRKSHFNAAHRLFNKSWNNSKNEEIFGLCSSPNYHGHNYDLVVKVTGEVDPETGFVIDTKELKDLIEEYILKRYDHKNLNLDVEDFKNTNPTAENIAIKIWNILREHIEKDHDLNVTLYETERNFVEYSGN